MLKIIGFVFSVASVIVGFFMGDGVLGTLWQPAYILIVAGGALGALVASTPGPVLKMTGAYLVKVIAKGTGSKEDYSRLLILLHDLFQVIRRNGRQALDEHIESPQDSPLFQKSGLLGNTRLITYICDNLRITNLGQISANELEVLLTTELETFETEQMQSVGALRNMSDATPGFGIVASVLGVIIAMSSIDGPISVLGMSVAGSMVGTMLGMFTCYGFLAPFISLITTDVNAQVMMFDSVKAALVANCSGRHPIVSVDSGRRVLFTDVRPSFVELEGMIQQGGI